MLPLPSEPVLEEMWRRLPDNSVYREAAQVLACGTHSRMGCMSLLRVFADLPEMIRSILLALVAAPLLVPDDFSTVQEAANAASSMQTIVIRSGFHYLARSGTHFAPTRLEKELHIVGQPGAILQGGLHFGIDSCGTMRNVELQGHLWVYDGLWEINGCQFSNRNQDAAVVVSNFAQAHFKECEIGGLPHAKSHHGLIQV
jgi:hypothetical protein